jgi:hypothetical protein
MSEPEKKRNKSAVLVTTPPKVKCIRCGSTSRMPYHRIRKMEHNHDGYTHVVWRYTSCRKCGQSRVERTME